MANKLVVIPEEVYLNLISPANVLQSGVDTRVLETNAKLSRTLHSAAGTNTEKYLEYDQGLKQLRSLLSKRDAPQSLETCLAGLLLKELKSMQKTTTTAETQTQNVATQSASAQTVDNEPASSCDGSSSTQSDNCQPPPDVSVTSTNNVNTTVSDQSSNLNPTIQRVKQEVLDAGESSNAETPKNKVDLLLELILKNPSLYGVTDDGRIMRSAQGKPYPKADLHSSLRYIIGEKITQPPPGTDILRENLLAIPETANLLVTEKEEAIEHKFLKVKNEPLGLVKGEFKPTLWDPLEDLKKPFASVERKRKTLPGNDRVHIKPKQPYPKKP